MSLITESYLHLSLSLSLFLFGFSRQGFPVALDPVLELALVDQAGLKLTEIHLPLPPSAGIKGMCHQRPAYILLFLKLFIYLFKISTSSPPPISLPLPPFPLPLFLSLWSFKTGFLCSFGVCPGTSSCRPGWPRTHGNPPASASQYWD